MLIAHLSDMHVAAPGAGLLQFVDGRERLAIALAHLAAMTTAPDVLLLTGDLVDHGTATEYVAAPRAARSRRHPDLPDSGQPRRPRRARDRVRRSQLPSARRRTARVRDRRLRGAPHRPRHAARRLPRRRARLRTPPVARRAARRRAPHVRRSCSCTIRPSPPASGGWTPLRSSGATTSHTIIAARPSRARDRRHVHHSRRSLGTVPCNTAPGRTRCSTSIAPRRSRKKRDSASVVPGERPSGSPRSQRSDADATRGRDGTAASSSRSWLTHEDRE